VTRLDRRQFVTRSATLLGAAAIGAGAEAGLGGSGGDARAATPAAELDDQGQRAGLTITVPYAGAHQAGILTPTQAQATLVSLDSIAVNRLALQEALMALGQRAQQLAAGSVNPLLRSTIRRLTRESSGRRTPRTG
jgi:hypothetical protein